MEHPIDSFKFLFFITKFNSFCVYTFFNVSYILFSAKKKNCIPDTMIE